MSDTVFARAEQFLWQNARLLERRLFAYHFKDGSRADVLAALAAYQNADGGFGNALEPDIRCPDSQPVPTQHALEFLDEVDFDAAMVQRICDYLLTITTAAGGVPWLLPSALGYPRAPWWQTGENPPAALNPTAAIAGLLHKHGVQHAWLAPATAFCWSKLAEVQATEMHEVGAVLTFLYHVPDRHRAGQALDRLVGALIATGLIADAAATGYVRKPLDWAPTPDHPLRKHFREEQIQAHLDAILAEQQADGGWSIPWPPLSPGCELEWRGWVTLSTLRRLQANGRLSV
ncbi:MAG: hypothetical protein DYG89_14415 [Caldilinea sp. CFX5]|nr:hypothetical protein [Caldilinea sp. CFX5]